MRLLLLYDLNIMEIKEIVAVRYIDACYFNRGERIPDDLTFTEHVAVGKIFDVNESDLTLLFMEKDESPECGLILPIKSLIFKEVHVLDPKLEQIDGGRIGSSIGVYWQDPIYFQNGSIPEGSTPMHSIGEIFTLNDRALALKSPKTFKCKEEIKTHPQNKSVDIDYLYIPKSLVTDLEYYE